MPPRHPQLVKRYTLRSVAVPDTLVVVLFQFPPYFGSLFVGIFGLFARSLRRARDRRAHLGCRVALTEPTSISQVCSPSAADIRCSARPACTLS